MIRQPGMNPARESWNRPGRSFRRDRSPVAPIRTTTWGYFGPTPAGILPTWPPPRSRDLRMAFRLPCPPAIVLASALDLIATGRHAPQERRWLAFHRVPAPPSRLRGIDWGERSREGWVVAARSREEQVLKTLRDGAGLAVADGQAIDGDDRGDLFR